MPVSEFRGDMNAELLLGVNKNVGMGISGIFSLTPSIFGSTFESKA